MECDTKKNFNGDFAVCKYVACYFVIGIHCFTVGRISNIFEFILFQGVSRLAVPCFFTISFYLFFMKTKKERIKESVIGYSKRMLKLISMWGMILFPYIIYVNIILPLRSSENVKITVLDIIIKNALGLQINGFWYMYASIICIILWFLLQNFLKDKLFIIILCLLTQMFCVTASTWANVCGNQMNEVYEFIEHHIGYCCNSFLVGIVYLFIARYLANTKKPILYEVRKVGLIISMLLFLLEIILIYSFNTFKYTDCYFMLPIVTYFALMNMLQPKIKKIKAMRYIRVSTTVLYITQFSIIFFLQGIFKRTIGVEFSPWLLFMSVILLGNLVVLLIMWLEDVKKWNWLRYMY